MRNIELKINVKEIDGKLIGFPNKERYSKLMDVIKPFSNSVHINVNDSVRVHECAFCSHAAAEHLLMKNVSIVINR